MEKQITTGIIPIEGEVIFIKENDIECGILHLIYTPGILVIHSIEVNELFRGNGYSKILIDNAISRAKLKEYKHIHLQCKTDNVVANNLYVSYGFRPILLDEHNNITYQYDIKY